MFGMRISLLAVPLTDERCVVAVDFGDEIRPVEIVRARWAWDAGIPFRDDPALAQRLAEELACEKAQKAIDSARRQGAPEE